MSKTLTLGLCCSLALVLGACGDDSAGGSGGSGGSAGGDAFLVANRVRTPDSRALFVSVLPSLDVGQVDLAGAIELSGVSRAVAFDGKVYGFDGESGVVTRYVVDGDRLVEDVLDDGSRARFGMSGVGVTSFTSQIIFLSSERAYYVDTLSLDQVVVWNPTAMTLTSTFPAPELAREGFSSTTGGSLIAIEDFVVMPVSWADQASATFVPTAAMIVFSASEDRVIGLIEDDRCVIARAAIADSGSVFLMADSGGGVADLFSEPGSVPPPCLLEWELGAAELNPDFYRDLRTITGFPLVSGAVGRGDGTFITQLYTSDIDPLTLEPLELLDLSLWQWGIVDFRSDTSTLIGAIPQGGVSSTGWVIDGTYMVPEFDDDGGQSALFQIDDPGATELLTVTGELFNVDRIR
ncbi:MAG: hypothetical protein AAF997_11120 [Myxococcota bacterium]